MKKTSFLIFTSETKPAFAGDGLNALLLAETLVSKNFESSIICLNPNGLLNSKEIINGVNINRITYRFKSNVGRFLLRLKMFFKLLKIGRKHSYWIIYGAMPSHRVVITIGWLLNRIVVFRSTLYGFDNADKLINQKKLFFREFNKFIYGRVNYYYALNNTFYAEWLNIFKNSNSIFKSSQGVNTAKYKKINRSKVQLREELDIPLSKPVVLMVGHLINRKGYPEIFEWLSRIEDDFLLLHIGRNTAPEWDALSINNKEMEYNKANGIGLLEHKIQLEGEKMESELYYLASDIFLMASYSEGFPSNSVNEAMAAGLPILCRKIIGSTEFVKENSNGLLFESEEEFRGRLKDLILNPSLRMELGNHNKILSQNNDIGIVVNNFLDFLH